LHGRTTGLIVNINVLFASQEATKPFYHNLINTNQGIVTSESSASYIRSFLQARTHTTPVVWAWYFSFALCDDQPPTSNSPFLHRVGSLRALEIGEFLLVRDFHPVFHIQLDCCMF